MPPSQAPTARINATPAHATHRHSIWVASTREPGTAVLLAALGDGSEALERRIVVRGAPDATLGPFAVGCDAHPEASSPARGVWSTCAQKEQPAGGWWVCPPIWP